MKKRRQRGWDIGWKRPWIHSVAGRTERLLIKVLVALLVVAVLIWAAVRLFPS